MKIGFAPSLPSMPYSRRSWGSSCASAQPDQLLQGLLPAPLDHSLHLGLLPVILMVVRVSEMTVSLIGPSHPLSAVVQTAAIYFLLLSAF